MAMGNRRGVWRGWHESAEKDAKWRDSMAHGRRPQAVRGLRDCKI